MVHKFPGWMSDDSPATHLLVEGSKGTPHIGAHVTRGLIGNLDASLQNGLWHNLGLWSSIDGLSREEASEVWMSSLSRNLQLALQVGDPALHEVHVVQEDPATFLGVLVQNGLSWPFLTLHNRSHVTVRYCAVQTQEPTIFNSMGAH